MRARLIAIALCWASSSAESTRVEGLSWSRPVDDLILDQVAHAVPERGRVVWFTHAQARRLLALEWRRVTGQAPSDNALDWTQVLAWTETRYGQGWRAGAGSNNWGAIHAPCGQGAFQGLDTGVDGTPYRACFAVYDTPRQGARAVITWLTRRPALLALVERGDTVGAVGALYDAGYFVGYGATREARIARRVADHQQALNVINGGN